MYESLYVEVNFISFLILAIIVVKMNTVFDRQARNIAFSRVILGTMGMLLLDIVWVFVEHGRGSGFRAFNSILNAAFFVLGAYVSCMWFFYVERALNPQVHFSKRAYFLLLLPLVLLSALCVASIWTGWIFFVNESNVYHRGNLHFVTVLVTYSYLVAASLHTLAHIRRAGYRQRRVQLITLLSFAVLPAIGGVISTMWFGIPAVWPGAALSLMLVFVDFQTAQISTDGLTGLNNRRQFDKYLYHLLSDARRTEPFFLFMMDIDAFKRINDTYGHVCGDEALAQTAALLKNVCRSRNAFLARYGGDEFVIVDHGSQSAADAEAFKARIKSVFTQHNESASQPYSLMLSIGYAAFDPAQPLSAHKLITQADQALYSEKCQQKVNMR